jgi:hypothetical protein
VPGGRRLAAEAIDFLWIVFPRVRELAIKIPRGDLFTVDLITRYIRRTVGADNEAT